MPTNNLPLSQKSIHKLSTKGLSREILKQEISEEPDFVLELWNAQGLKIKKHNAKYYFDTKFIPLDEAVFCIVDIETNGSKIDKHQIIEIAAIKIKNKKIIDSFDTLVKCDKINPAITEITGIKATDTVNSPDLKEVLYEFKNFLEGSIFVAHDVKFDYKFISDSFVKIGLMPLLNRSLCSIDLAQRTISSYKYGLKYLNEYLKLNPDATHHRAMSDVLTTYKLFIKSLQNLPDEIKTVEDLINFSKNSKKLKRPQFDPLLKEKEDEEKD
jgi:DNA polymerase-3 subunit epsilon